MKFIRGSALLLTLCLIGCDSQKEERKSADKEDPEAHFQLGKKYLTGEGVPEDYVEAVKWLRKAADQGHAGAQTYLASCYANGRGVPEDHAESMKLFSKAAEQGHAEAQFVMAICYENGDNIPEDLVTAYMWCNLANAQGFDDAKKFKRELMIRMTKEQIAEAQKLSREWMEKHAK